MGTVLYDSADMSTPNAAKVSNIGKCNRCQREKPAHLYPVMQLDMSTSYS